MSVFDTVRRDAPASLRHALMFCSIPHASLVELAGSAGFGGVVIDDEKFHSSPETVQSMVLACEKWDLLSLMRLRVATPERLDYAICQGVRSVLLPRLEHAAQVEELVRGLWFPPRGTRGHGASRSLLYGTEAAGDPPTVQVIVETESLLDEVDQVAALEGVAGLDIGVLDLSAALGVEGSLDDPTLSAAIEKVIGAARAQGKSVAMSVPDVHTGTAWVERGLTGFVIDPLRLLRRGFATDS